MIIWLASYPKSGNTLIRSVLATYFFSKHGIFNFDHLYKIGQFPSLDFFKKAGIDISNKQEIFKNYISAQQQLNQQHHQPHLHQSYQEVVFLFHLQLEHLLLLF